MLSCEHSFLKENSDGCFLNIHNYYDSSHQDSLHLVHPSNLHCVKCPNAELFLVCIFLYSDRIRIPYNLRIVNLRILSQYSKIRTRNNYVFGQFSRSGLHFTFPEQESNSIIPLPVQNRANIYLF